MPDGSEDQTGIGRVGQNIRHVADDLLAGRRYLPMLFRVRDPDQRSTGLEGSQRLKIKIQSAPPELPFQLFFRPKSVNNKQFPSHFRSVNWVSVILHSNTANTLQA